jgi:hypothetical protein
LSANPKPNTYSNKTSEVSKDDFNSDIAFIISSIGEQNQFQRLPKSGVTALLN